MCLYSSLISIGCFKTCLCFTNTSNLSVLKLYPLFAFIDCPEGFYGLNCSLKCRYPNYGIDCQKDCSQCGRKLCNFIYGCPTGTVPIPDGYISFNSFNFPINHNILTTLKHPKRLARRIIFPFCPHYCDMSFTQKIEVSTNRDLQ